MQFLTLFLGVALLNLFAVITILLRPKIFKVKIYRPMLLNFKLSILPLIILLANILVFLLLSVVGAYLHVGVLNIVAHVLFFVGLLIWLLFLPNSGYLITELNLNHREQDEREVPIWYDIVSVLSFALSGIVNTLANIVLIQLSFLIAFDPQELTSSNYVMLFLSGFGIILLIVLGIYLGRTIRFNSWDILHVRSFFGKLKTHFAKQGTIKEFILYIALNTIFFLIMYTTFGIPFYFVR